MEGMKMARQSKVEYLKMIYQRYHRSDKEEKGKILDEFSRVCGYVRKYAIDLLSQLFWKKQPPRRQRKRSFVYSAQAIGMIEQIWQVAGYPWSKRLKAIIPLWMPWIEKRFGLEAKTQKELLRISSRQIDRRLKDKKLLLKKRRYGTTKPGSLLKHQIPIRTKSWDITQAGYLELDTVARLVETP